MELMKETIKSQLRTGVHSIHFTKKSGEDRLLEGTLDPLLIPIKVEPDDDTVKPKRHKGEVSTDAIAVYCPTLKGWRSFNVSNLISIEPV